MTVAVAVRVVVEVGVAVEVGSVPVTVGDEVLVGVAVGEVVTVRVDVGVGVMVAVGRVPVTVGLGVCGPTAKITLPTKASTNVSVVAASPVVRQPPFASAL